MYDLSCDYYLLLHIFSLFFMSLFYITSYIICFTSTTQEQQCTTVNEQVCSTQMETTYENECTTVQEQKCEIQYMTQYEEQCTTQNENASYIVHFTF